MAFKNYIKDEDIKKYSPTIGNFLYSTQTDYQTQIDLAGNLVLIDLRAQNIDTRLVYVENDLQTVYNTTNINTPITSTAVSGTFDISGPTNLGLGYQRFGINIDNFNGTGSIGFKLQGCNKVVGLETESDWHDIVSLTASADGEYSTTYIEDTRLIRYKLIGTGSFDYSVWTQDTALDDMIIVKSLEMIYSDFCTNENDNFDRKRLYFEALYNKLLNGSKMLIDTLDNGKPNTIDNVDSAGTLKFY